MEEFTHRAASPLRSTSATDYTVVLSHETGELPAGLYFVQWYYEAAAAEGESVEVRVTADGSALGEGVHVGVGRHQPSSGFGIVRLDSGGHVVDVAFRDPDGASPARVRNIRVAAWKLP